MLIAKRIALVLLLLPVGEIAVILMMIGTIGFLKTALLMVLTSLVGVLILRQAGRPEISRFRTAVARGETTSRTVSGREFFTVLGGILLLLPGFITDALGLLLLLPPVRRGIGATIRRLLFRDPAGTQPPSVLDLDPDEWRRHPDRRLTRRKRPAAR